MTMLESQVMPAVESDALAGAPLERSNILIVDDRLDKRVVFRTILEELDQNIVTASSGEKALVQLHRLNAELKKRSDERVALVKEQAARSMAEESQRRASFLAEATQVMASSLDVDTILKGASGLVVPFLADYGAVVLVNEDGSIRAQRSSSVAGWNPYIGSHTAAFEANLAQLRAHA